MAKPVTEEAILKRIAELKAQSQKALTEACKKAGRTTPIGKRG